MLPIASFLSAALIGWAWIATVFLAVSLGGTRHEVRPLIVPSHCAQTCIGADAEVTAVALTSVPAVSRAQ